MRLQKLANAAVVTLNVEDSLNTAIEQMWRLNIRHLPVVDQGSPVGIVSERDVLFHVCWLEESTHSFTSEREEPLSDASRVDQVMTRPVITLSPEDPVEKAARLMLNKRISAIPLTAGNHIVGIVTETDLLRCYNDDAVPIPSSKCRHSRVEDHMAAHVFALRPGDATLTAIRLMRDKQVRHVPVVEGEELVGIVSDRDVLRGAARDESAEPMSVAELRAAPQLQVRGLMSTNVEVLYLSAMLEEAAMKMVVHKFGALPVVDKDTLVGILTETDLLRAFVMDCEQ